MASFELNATLFPYRLRFGEKGAGELTLEVKNTDAVSKNVVVELLLPSVVSTNKSGLAQSFQKRLANFESGKTFVSKVPIFLSPHAEIGVHSGKLRVIEFAGQYDYEIKRMEKEIGFRIIE